MTEIKEQESIHDILYPYKHIFGDQNVSLLSISEILEIIVHYYENIINSMPGNVYWFDKNCITEGANRNVLDMLGFNSINEFKGLNFEELGKLGNWTKKAEQSFKQDSSEVLATGIPKINIEEPPIPHTDGRMIYFLSNRVPIYGKNGKVIGFVGISIDITDRKVMEQKLVEAKEAAEKANRIKSEFLAVVSHELRLPLTAILGMAQLLKDQTLSDEEQKKYIEHILASGNHLVTLINNILDFSKLNEEKYELFCDTIDFKALTKEIYEIFQLAAQQKNIDLTFEYADEVPNIIYGDSRALKQIIINLIGNAIKFTSEGSVALSIACLEQTEKSASLKISIKDTGIGIPDDKKEIIFDKFEQVDNSHTRRFSGTGIGLSITKKLIELMGGTIEVESRLGEGSCFNCIIPFQKLRPNEVNEKELRVNSKVLDSTHEIKTISVLLVEDDKVIELIHRKFLEKLNCRVLSAESGAAALQILKIEKIDLILLDVGLPDISGYDTASLIRNRSYKKQIPIIALTGFSDEMAKQECFNAGIERFITKPIAFEQLQKLVDDYR